ncbi:MAG: dicarboxylate transporter/tellurite-resistance protein TehA [Alphaproteobacteria bacterium]|nr:dicarboxylate transporter/tellurite-resistance protein TehA [Acetobacteraceae bacterium]MBV9377508.1 dicarboxylate transporter/tellurite-resistance protein TehA [Alphaproteobacteria bacterium]
MLLRSSLPLVPASFFSIALGLLGLGLAWRTAARAWNLPPIAGEVVLASGIAVWAVVALLYAAKWLFDHTQALAEFEHPIHSCFIGLAPVTSLLVGLATAPYSQPLAIALFGLGASGVVSFAVYHTGRLWRGEQDASSVTPSLYLPTVAGGFVIAIAASGLGWQDWGRFAFGAGLFSWLAIESVLLHRLYAGTAFPAALRPVLGIQLAPPSVAALAYLSIESGVPDIFVQGLIGYAILQALVLLRLLPWITAQPFAPPYWSFSFGAAALASAAAGLAERDSAGAIAELAPWLFIAANLLILLLAAKTLALLVMGKLLPARAASTAVARARL